MLLADTEPELDRLEARMAALRLAARTQRTSPHRLLWLADLQHAQQRWHQLADQVLTGR